ncbi:MAG: DUF3145 domain-containing protein [Propionibacteriaceae bacterium]|nr:DUF3145 domain-containing protein [Propionibacteriaceae bacterium]
MTTRRTGLNATPLTRGVIFIHSAPAPLCPHIEWAIGGVLGTAQHIDWTTQTAQRGTLRAELSWTGKAGTGAELASRLKAMQRLRFEVTEEAAPGSEGRRYAYTPTLGIFTATIGLHGDLVVPEERLRQAMIADSLGERPLSESVPALLGTDWDAELDIFRHASEEAPVRWLHQVV